MSARWSLALAAAALTACVSYAGMRLVDRVGEPPMGAILLQAHVPYYWRVGAAALHATIVAVTLHALLDEDRALRGLAALPRWVWALGLPAAALMWLFP